MEMSGTQRNDQQRVVAQDSDEETFELIAGAISLDFANTVGGMRGGSAFEHLHDYADLVRWGRQAQILPAADAERLVRIAHQRPADAEVVMARARTLREAVYAIFAALADEVDPSTEAVAQLNDELSRALAHLGVGRAPDGFVWQWRAANGALDATLWPIARSAAELLVSPAAHSIHQCANPTCSWLFLDTSRNHSRRWCDMRGCGNRAKVRRHRARAREESDHAEFV